MYIYKNQSTITTEIDHYWILSCQRGKYLYNQQAAVVFYAQAVWLL